jgi:putative flippase GtrA
MTGRQPSAEYGRFLRFLIVGGSVSAIFSVITAGLIRFANTPPFWTSVVVYLACIPLAFYAQKRFAFDVAQTRKSAFWIYFATQLCSLALVSGVTTRFVTKIFWFDTGLLLVTSALAAVLSYLIGRFITFAPPR